MVLTKKIAKELHKEQAEKEHELARGKTISCCAEGWHQGCCNGYTRNDIALAASGDGDNAGSPAKEGYQDIVKSG